MAKKNNSKLEAKSSPLIILTFTPVWQRPEVFAICLEGIKRLVNYAPERFKIIPFFMVSESWAATVVQNAGFNYIHVQNNPLGNKKNKGLKYALENFKFDYLLEIGSDDLIADRYLDIVETELRAKTPQLSPSIVWFASPFSNKTSYYEPGQKIVGLGRFLHRSVLEKVEKAELWNPEGERGMDTFSWRHLAAKYNVKNKQIELTEILLLDIKTPVNINTIDRFIPSGVPASEVLAHFPETKFGQLKNILQKQTCS